MPILRVNAVGCQTQCVQPNGTTVPLADAVDQNLGNAPVLIMLHGYRYSPSQPHASPHNYILQDRHIESWPHQMGYGTGTPDLGLCIAFGWEAGGTIWRAHREAGRTGLVLASLIRHLSARGAGPINIMAHSLGARVALACLPHVAPGMIDRMILMTGAELKSTAETALMTPAGRRTKVLNVVSRENDLFDFLYEWLLVPHQRGARTMAAGLSLPHCVTAQIDHPDHLSGLHDLGFPIGITTRRICHWSSYTRPGLFAVYRSFLAGADALDFTDLRLSLPITLTRRWSHLRHLPVPPAPLRVQ